MTVKKIIDGLYFTIGMMLFNPITGESKTPDELNEDDRTTYDACMGAINVLKAQEPRVMTLEDLYTIYNAKENHIWPKDTSPCLYFEVRSNQEALNGWHGWLAWRDIAWMLDGGYLRCNSENYGKMWRCWTAKPTEKRRLAVPWQDT